MLEALLEQIDVEEEIIGGEGEDDKVETFSENKHETTSSRTKKQTRERFHQ